uniref:Uncharacterized protein n=1 Tax=Romanomermis culicivorax TaxID=13658 RepID=A0A915HVX7_ROMCU
MQIKELDDQPSRADICIAVERHKEEESDMLASNNEPSPSNLVVNLHNYLVSEGPDAQARRLLTPSTAQEDLHRDPA